MRYDIVDTGGTITLRHAGKLKHLGIGRGHARVEVICLVHGHEATVITPHGDVIAEFMIDPERVNRTKRVDGIFISPHHHAVKQGSLCSGTLNCAEILKHDPLSAMRHQTR